MRSLGNRARRRVRIGQPRVGSGWARRVEGRRRAAVGFGVLGSVICAHVKHLCVCFSWRGPRGQSPGTPVY